MRPDGCLALQDLLHEDQVKPRVGTAAIGGKIEVRESSSGVVSIHGATSVEVVTAEDVEGVSRRGLANRAVASTKSNDRSSRSHMVLMIDVEVRERASQSGEGGCVISSGRLSLVDLAGSERISKSEAAGLALTEAKHINKSLSALIDVMSALSERDRKDKASAAVQIKTGGEGKAAVAHIPFRNSKLTHLLMGSLKPGSKLVFITQVRTTDNYTIEPLTLTIVPMTNHAHLLTSRFLQRRTTSTRPVTHWSSDRGRRVLTSERYAVTGTLMHTLLLTAPCIPARRSNRLPKRFHLKMRRGIMSSLRVN